MLQLSQAIILGDTLKKCDPETWISPDGTCGCALGGALLADGTAPEQFWAEYWEVKAVWRMNEMPCIQARWPWLTFAHMKAISEIYRQVAAGEKTIEDVASYVRTVEPAEQSTTGILDAQEVAEVV